MPTPTHALAHKRGARRAALRALHRPASVRPSAVPSAMPPKTSFKALLGKAGANPTVNLAAVRAQREHLQGIRKASAKEEPLAKVARAAMPPPAVPSAPRMPEAGAAAAAAAARTTDFIASAVFAGKRAGFVFKAGERGVGYYRDALAPSAPDVAPDEPGDPSEEGAAPDGPLPQNFFDNPQQDPANRGREVASTRKQQTLNEEFEEFSKQVTTDLQAADEADEEAEEDEEEVRLREAVSVAREMERKVDTLRERRNLAAAAATASSAAGPPSARLATTSGANATLRDGGSADDDDDDDDEADDESMSALFDWRAKQV